MKLLVHLAGLDNPSGLFYLFWSGIGAYLTILGAVFAHYKRHTCHVDAPRFCWRPGVHPVPGTPFRACKKHHPLVPDRVSADHIADAHTAASEGTQS